MSSLLVNFKHINDSVGEVKVGDSPKSALRHTSNNKKWRLTAPKDVLYTHYGPLKHLRTLEICITYNPRGKTLTGGYNKVRK